MNLSLSNNQGRFLMPESMTNPLWIPLPLSGHGPPIRERPG